MRTLERVALATILVILGATTLSHLPPYLDDPHSWRQADTANYARELLRTHFDWLHPRVCWVGSHAVVAIECPTYELVVAGAYRLTGESLPLARIVTLVSLAVAMFYLYRIVRLFGDVRWAMWSAVLFWAAPLSIYYGRAVMIDMPATALTHAMAFYVLSAIGRAAEHVSGWWKWMVGGVICGVLAFVTKGPYPAILCIPILVVALQRLRGTRLIAVIMWMTIPWAAFIAWTLYARGLNSQAPDLTFNPGSSNLADLSLWYFGNVQQRLVASNWILLATRLLVEVVTLVGAPLFIIGCVLYVRRYKLGMMITWLGGTVLYLIVLFNSNGQHNYYQIPFVAPLSVMSALCVAEMTKRGRVWSIAAMCLVVTLVVGSVRYCNETFFVRDLVREMAAAAIARNTTRADVIATGMMDSGPGDPRLLYRADRLGFSANSQVMSPDVIEGFRKNGATVLAMVTREREVLSNEIRSMGYPFNSVPLVQGRVRVGLVHLARLEDPSTGRARGPGGPAAEPR